MLDVGDFAVSLKGRDKDRQYLVLAVEPPFVYVADGVYRSGGNPKKKRATHVRRMSRAVGPAVLDDAFRTAAPDEQDRRIRSLIAGAYAIIKGEEADV